MCSLIARAHRHWPVELLCSSLCPCHCLGEKAKEAALMAAQVVRILVAIEPLMYREVLALHFRQERPLSEVILASSQALQAEAERTKLHLIVANEVPPELKEEGSSFWVELRVSDVLVATQCRRVLRYR